MLWERSGWASPSQRSGAGFKPLHAAGVKSVGGERCRIVETRSRQARCGKASASEPLLKRRKLVRRRRDRGLSIFPGQALRMT